MTAEQTRALVEAAEVLRRLAELIAEGQLVASPVEAAFLAGAAVGLDLARSG